MEDAKLEPIEKQKPVAAGKRRVVTRHIPAPKPLITPLLLIAILTIFGFVILIVVAALTYKDPNATTKPGDTSKPTDPGEKPNNPNTPPPKPDQPKPKPPVGWEWVGDAKVGKTSLGGQYSMVTSWYGPAGTFDSIRIDVKLIDSAKGGLSAKYKQFEIGLNDYIEPLASMLVELYNNGGLDSIVEGTDPWYAQNMTSWELMPDLRTLHYLDKKAPNGKPIPVATPTLLASFSGPVLSSIPPGNIAFVAKNIFAQN